MDEEVQLTGGAMRQMDEVDHTKDQPGQEVLLYLHAAIIQRQM
jgi:hypothetical protein